MRQEPPTLRSEADSAFERLARGGLRGRPADALALLESAWDELDRWVAVALRALGVPPRIREDCGQEALLRVWKGRSGYRGSSAGELRAWIFRICQRESFRLLDAQRRRPLNESDSAAAEDDPPAEVLVAAVQGGGSERMEEAEATDALSACIQGLQAKARQVIELLYSAGSPTEREVAGLIGISKSQVNVLRQKALAGLAACLHGKGFEA